jgi:hypothetical protein
MCQAVQIDGKTVTSSNVIDLLIGSDKPGFYQYNTKLCLLSVAQAPHMPSSDGSVSVVYVLLLALTKPHPEQALMS